jgi:urease accessory protein
MSVRHVLRISSAVAALVVAAAPASAHTGIGAVHGFGAGLLHPISGLDHVLAMVAVGMLAATIGGRALWLVPASFVTAMVAGGVLGMSGVAVPGVEQGILASVVVLGATVAVAQRMPAALAMALAAGFAVFHGHAHGAEMPAAASGLSYGLGFVIATVLLHGAGIAAGLGAERLSRTAVRVGGGAIAALGLVLFLV